MTKTRRLTTQNYRIDRMALRALPALRLTTQDAETWAESLSTADAGWGDGTANGRVRDWNYETRGIRERLLALQGVVGEAESGSGSLSESVSKGCVMGLAIPIQGGLPAPARENDPP